MLAPSNLAISKALLNMFLINAVLRKILYGWPVNLSFLTISTDSSTFNTTPVAAIRNPGLLLEKDCTQQNGVAGAIRGPYIVAKQCICSGVYLSMRFRVRESEILYIGIV